MLANYIPGTDIPYKLHTTWAEALDAIRNRTKYRSIYPYVFSDDMVYVIIHRPSREFYCAYKKSTGKNDNFSSFFFWKNIGNLEKHPDQFDVYATDYWYGPRVQEATEQVMRQKVTELAGALERKHYYTLDADFKTFARA